MAGQRWRIDGEGGQRTTRGYLGPSRSGRADSLHEQGAISFSAPRRNHTFIDLENARKRSRHSRIPINSRPRELLSGWLLAVFSNARWLVYPCKAPETHPQRGNRTPMQRTRQAPRRLYWRARPV